MTVWLREPDDTAFTLAGWPVLALATTRAAGDMRDEARRGVFCRSRGIPPERIVRCRQVHGATVVPVTSKHAGREIPDSDGLITGEKGLALAIFTADCVPVVLCDTKGSALAVVHGGWRGLAAGIVPVAVRLFKEYFCIAPSDLRAAAGPHIQKCCYPVGDAVRKAFDLGNAETHCDLASVLDRQLALCGVPPAERSGECTGHRKDLFFSYRGDATPRRMMTIAGLKGVHEFMSSRVHG